MFINENRDFLFNNRTYLLPKFYLDIFLKFRKHFPVLTLAIVGFFSQPFFLSMVIFSDELFNLNFVHL